MSPFTLQLLSTINKSREAMNVFSNFSCYFGFMQISAQKFKGQGYLATCKLNTLLLARCTKWCIEVISNNPIMRRDMFNNTAVSTNSNNTNDKNHRTTVILDLCKLCPFLFPNTPSVVYLRYINTQKLYRCSKRAVIKIMKSIIILSLCKLCIFMGELWAGLRYSRDLINIILVKRNMV